MGWGRITPRVGRPKRRQKKIVFLSDWEVVSGKVTGFFVGRKMCVETMTYIGSKAQIISSSLTFKWSVSIGFNRLQFPLGAMKLTCVLALLVALANADEGSQQLRGASPDAAGQETDARGRKA